jgi:hypothetical protein
MLVQCGRRQRVVGRGRGQGYRVPDARDAGRRDDRAQAQFLGRGHAAVHGVDRAAREAGRGEYVEPLARGPPGQPLGEQRPQLLPVGRAAGVLGEPWVGRQFRRAEHLAQPGELSVVADRDDQVAVAGRQRLVREQAGMGIPHPHRHDAARHVSAGLVDHAGQGR